MSLMIDSWIDWLTIDGLAWLILVIHFYTSVSSLRKSARLSAQRSLQRVQHSLLVPDPSPNFPLEEKRSSCSVYGINNSQPRNV